MEYYFSCPKCKRSEEFLTVKERSDMASTIFLFGGFLSALLYADYTSRRIQCARCTLIFRQPPLPRTPLSRLAVWIINLIIVFFILIAFFIYVPELDILIPDIKFFSEIESFISSHTKLFAFLVPLMLISIVLSCMVSSFVSNFTAHRELKKKFKVKPEHKIAK